MAITRRTTSINRRLARRRYDQRTQRSRTHACVHYTSEKLTELVEPGGQETMLAPEGMSPAESTAQVGHAGQAGNS